jgi:hypothetical protein
MFGLTERRGRKTRGPGHALVTVERHEPRKVSLSGARVTAWKIAQRPRWRATAEVRLTLRVPSGEHTIRIATSPAAVAGAGLIIEAAGVPAGVSYEPPLPDRPLRTGLEEPALPSTPREPTSSGVEEPPLPGQFFEPALPAIEEPALLAAPDVPSAGHRNARMTMVGAQPATHVVASPVGRERFLAVRVDDRLRLAVYGPGLLELAVHAHRAESISESLRPVIVSVLVDEVLTQNVSIVQGPSPEYRIEGAPFLPSLRVNVRVPIEDGRHEVQLTLSDSAVLGASILPRFVDLTDVDEPGLLTAKAARAGGLRAGPAVPEVSGTFGLGIAAAAWLPSGMQHVGMAALADGTLGLPVAGPRVSVGLVAGYGRTEDPRPFADWRVPSGASRANVVVSTVPLIANARWSAPLPQPVAVEAGLGAGVQLLWTEVRSRGIRLRYGPRVTPTGFVDVALLVRVGPGAFFARGAYLAAAPIDTDRLRGFDASGGIASVGYRWALVSAD